MPLFITPAATNTSGLWLDGASNWIALEELRDSATGALVSNAAVTVTIVDVQGTPSLGPFTLAARAGVPGAYDTVVLSPVFRVGSAVRIAVRAQYGDNKIALFSQVLSVSA